MSLSKKSILLVFLILLVDQVVKIWIKTHMVIGDEYHVFGHWFIIHFTENNGMAFGMEFWGKSGKLFLSLFRIIAIVAIGYYVVRIIKQNSSAGLVLGISAILAGAIGNLIDSAFYGMIFTDSFAEVARFLPAEGGYASFLHGRVVDMLYFPIVNTTYPSWFPFVGGESFVFFRPVFNIADSAITTGVLYLLIFQRKILFAKG
ncbi:MAG TPA: lipoprotein signal peptidase [Bacteroidales bacterium]|nr:lipoprotein signal peptidase [Bacteroidales bacterium]